MKNLLSAILFMLIIIPASAQVADGLDQQINLDDIGREGNMGVVRTFDHRFEGVKGTPFFVDRWIKGSVFLENGKIYKDIPLKYDVYQNEVLAYTRGQAIYITRDIINNFVLRPDSVDYEIKFTKVKPANELKKINPHQFFRVLYEGDYKLLELEGRVFLKANYQGAYSANKPYDEFENTSRFYYLDPQNNLQKLKTSIGGTSKVFGEHKKAIKDYIFEQNLDPKVTGDLIRIFKKGDSL